MVNLEHRLHHPGGPGLGTPNSKFQQQQLPGQSKKKWPLLVRSLSDSAKYNRPPHGLKKPETKALTLSLSDSRLFKQHHKKSSLQLLDMMSVKDPETCSCGCDQDVEDEDDEDDEVEGFSEDEGCFVITNVPQSNAKQQEVTNKVREGTTSRTL